MITENRNFICFLVKIVRPLNMHESKSLWSLFCFKILKPRQTVLISPICRRRETNELNF